MIIAITNLKGGVGKSTITQNLAVCLAHMGYKVCIVDTDENQNSMSWNGARDEDLPNITVVGAVEQKGFSKAVKSLHQDYEIVLVDGTPSLSAMTTSIIVNANLIIIPLRPSAQDFRTMDKFLSRYNDAVGMKGEIPAYFLLNEYDERKIIHRGIKTTLEETYDIPFLKIQIGSRTIYNEASVEGLGVYEATGDNTDKARQEMINLTNEVLETASVLNLVG
ncbi:ParA family protein [Gilvibacter sp.]|uniref:ParA family protein n=1 Tax=Gilvibacter sp. TaxID=2729997 RepID=UPI0025BE4749|nr:ParA family protein [Gilvibacter sp.]NQX78827.1 ParA family protein [Gilvibacter sp.]